MSDGKIIIDTDLDSSGVEKGLNTLKSKIGGAMGSIGGVMAKGVAIASGAVTALVGGAVNAYAEYEQAVGGIETLFKESSNTVMEYAKNAYKTAGLSANEYMNTITSFSASLLQGLGGDTAKAAEIGNMAVTDMSDNVNKMGSNMEDVQNAYQGFAKQNYTMLDNLKLGYGGTKEEMQRLLVDAEKLTGIHYDINNFSDVIEAIHAVQDNIGITGTTAKEAESTISGSLAMVKSSWTNLLTGMGDSKADLGKLINELVDSVTTLGTNLMPVVQNILDGVVQLINNLFPVIASKLPELLATLLPQLINSGISIIQALITGIQQNLPMLMQSAMTIINSLLTALLQMLPQLLDMGIQIICQLAIGIGQQAPTLIPLIIDCIIQMVNTLINNLPLIIDAGMQLLDGLVTGILNALPKLIENIPKIIETIVTTLTSKLPDIIATGGNILLKLVDGIVNNIPRLVEAIPKIITGFINGISTHLPRIIETGILIIGKLAVGLIKAIPQLVAALPQIINAILQGFAQVDWAQIGVNIVKGIWNGIKSLAGWLWNKVSGFAGGIVNSFKSKLGIHSPSRVMRDMVGKFIPAGISVGIEKGMPKLENDTMANLKSLYTKMQGVINSDSLGLGNRSVGNSYVNNIVNNTNPNIINKIANVLNIDGREVATAIAPYQEVFDNYALGR